MNINTKILSQKVKKVIMAFKFNLGGLYIMSRSTMAVKTRHDLYMRFLRLVRAWLRLVALYAPSDFVPGSSTVDGLRDIIVARTVISCPGLDRPVLVILDWNPSWRGLFWFWFYQH